MKTAGFYAAFILGAAVSAYAQLGADNKPLPPPRPPIDPYAACGRAFHEKLYRLSAKERRYDESYTQATAEADLDGEGTLDFIVAQSEPNLAPCGMTGWETHSNLVSIRYDADHRWDHEFQGDLIRGMRVYKDRRMVQVYGERADGSGWQLTIPYEIPEGRGAAK